MRPMTRMVLGLVVLIGIFAAVAHGLPSHVTVTRDGASPQISVYVL